MAVQIAFASIEPVKKFKKVSLFHMTSEERIHALRKDTFAAVSCLATEFQGLIQDAAIDTENQLVTSCRKLQLDVHTMRIDQSARKLLCVIRAIKELKVSNTSFQENRAQFERDCERASEPIREVLRKSYDELSRLTDAGFEVRQAASKLLRG
jgi:hypothetical protein